MYNDIEINVHRCQLASI